MSACSSVCGYCGRCTAAWERELADDQPEVPSPIAMAERNALEAVTELRQALTRCERVEQVLALKARISALWLAWDCLDQEALRRADAILLEATGL